MNKSKSSKYKSKYKKEVLPQFGWGSTIGGIAGTVLGTAIGGPGLGSTIGGSLGSALGGGFDSEENTQGKLPNMPPLNIDQVNTQQFYNPIKAYGGGIPPTNYYKTDKKAYVDSVLTANKDKEWVNRLYQKNTPNINVPGQKHPSTHLMSDNGNGYVFPSVVNMNGKLQYLGDRAEDYARETNTGIQLPKEQGTWFARNGYKQGSNVLSGYAYGGQTQPNAEVEGNEVIQYQPGMQPQANGQGNMQQIASDMSVAQGPTHANGGVPINAQPGSMVVSDRLPAPNTKEYKSIANKVEMLGRKKGQLEKKVSGNPTDKIAKDTVGLIQKQIDTLIQQQEQMKMQYQQGMTQEVSHMAYGGTVDGNERLDPMFLKLWNTGAYAMGGEIPKYYIGGDTDGEDDDNMGFYGPKFFEQNKFPFTQSWRSSASSANETTIPSGLDFIANDMLRGKSKNLAYTNYGTTNNLPTQDELYPGIKMNKSGFDIYNQAQDFGINGSDNYSTPNFKKYQFNTQPTTISGKYNEFGQNKYGIDNATLGVENNIDAPFLKGGNPTTNESMMQAAKISGNPTDGKVPLKDNSLGSGLQYAAQYVPDIMAMFTKKDKPIDPTGYMTQQRINPARYDTRAKFAQKLSASSPAFATVFPL